MSQISINAVDRIVTKDGISYQVQVTAEMIQAVEAAPITAIQVSGGRAEIEFGRPMNRVVFGDQAQAAIQPFLDAWEVAHAAALEAAEEATETAGQPEGTDGLDG